MDVKRCVQCGEEYRPDAVRCADCGGELEVVDDETVPYRPGQPRAEAPAEPQPDPTAGYESIFMTRELSDLEPMAGALGAAGVTFALTEVPTPHMHSVTYFLRVPPDQRARALELIGPFVAEGFDALATERGFDPETGYGVCPACAAELLPAARTCPECDLTLAGSEDED